jgi:hypothetical protein
VTEPPPPAGSRDLDPGERSELERLRSEAVERRRPDTGRRRHSGWRAPLAVVLIVLGCVLAPVAVLGVWAGNEVSDTGRWVATVDPLIHDPAIQNVLTDKITNEITGQLNLNGTLSQAAAQLGSKGLPRVSSLLKTFGPQIASGTTSFIHNAVHKIITSPAMARAWVQVNTVAHQGVVQVLSGQGSKTSARATARSCSSSARSSRWPNRTWWRAGSHGPPASPTSTPPWPCSSPMTWERPRPATG